MKKIAIMQPYFLPYLGYISLVKHTDEFILFDTVQFIRHGWIERNRMLKQNGGWLYIKVPLLPHSRETLIRDVIIDNNQNWRQVIISQLQTYKKIAPYYWPVMKLVQDVFTRDYDSIVELNRVCLQSVCAYLDINRPIKIFSEMTLEVKPATAPDEWALNICKAIGSIDEYWNLPGGQSFFNESKYDKEGIKLVFQSVKLDEYDQGRASFEAGLSILDVMMFNSKEKINKMLDHYELI